MPYSFLAKERYSRETERSAAICRQGTVDPSSLILSDVTRRWKSTALRSVSKGELLALQTWVGLPMCQGVRSGFAGAKSGTGGTPQLRDPGTGFGRLAGVTPCPNRWSQEFQSPGTQAKTEKIGSTLLVNRGTKV